jgi:hypothetical protein
LAFDTSIIVCSFSIDPAKVLVERESRLVDWMSMDVRVEGRIPAGRVPATIIDDGQLLPLTCGNRRLTGYI